MCRPFVFVVLAALTFGISGTSQDDPKPKVVAKAQNATETQASKAVLLMRQLEQPFGEDREFDSVPLKEFLTFITERKKTKFLINHQIFRENGIDKLEDVPVKVPKMSDYSLALVLRQALAVINGTYLIRGDYVEITTQRAIDYEFHSNFTVYPRFPLINPPLQPTNEEIPAFFYFDRQFFPLVHLDVKDQPANLVLGDIGEQAKLNIVFRKVDDLARSPVTISATNMPADLAVRLVADMVGLDAVRFGKSIYVCDRERGRHFDQEYEKLRERMLKFNVPTIKRVPPGIPNNPK